MTKEIEREEAFILADKGYKITEIVEKLNVSRPTLNRWGLDKEYTERIATKLIEEGRLAGIPAEDLSVTLEAPVRKIKHIYKEEAVKEAKRLKQPVETYTEKLRAPKTLRTRTYKLGAIVGFTEAQNKEIEEKITKKQQELIQKDKNPEEIREEIGILQRKLISEIALEKPKKLKQREKETKEAFEERKKASDYDKAIKDREASYPGIFDLWSFVVEGRKARYLLTTEEGLFASSTLNIPYVQYQPAKRIYLTSKSLFEWKLEKYGDTHRFIPESNFVKLNNPDPCLITGIRHDVDTINVTVGLPQSERDYEIVREDACLISKSAAKRLTFTHLKKIVYKVDKTEVIPPKKAIKEGEVLGEDMDGNEFVSLYNGVFSIIHEKEIKGSEKKVIVGNVRIERTAGLGDKITGLTGLKVVIGEVRQDLHADIIVSDNQIWNIEKEDGQRGGMVKELLATGKIMVGLRKDTILENQASRNKGASLSSTLYQVLAPADKEVTKEIIKDNSRFEELLKTLHLKYNAKQRRFTLLSEKEIDLDEEGENGEAKWIEYPHYCYTESEFKKHFEAIKPQIPFTVMGIDHEGKKLLHRHDPLPKKYATIAPARYVVWNYCYNPSFIPEGYLGKKGVRENALFEPLGKSKGVQIENTLADRVAHVKAKFPFAVTPKRTQAQVEAGTFLSSSIQAQVENQVFCDIRNGFYLVAIPSVDLSPDTIEINNPAVFGKEHNDDLYALVVREPVVSKGNIACVKIHHNPDLPLGVVKVSLEVMKACQGDYDGDRIAVLGYFSKAFMVKGTGETLTIGNIMPENLLPSEEKSFRAYILEDFLEDLEPQLKKRNEKELKEEAFTFMERITDEKRWVADYGGLRRKAAFKNPERVQSKILALAGELEVILKAELKTPEWKSELKDKTDQLRKLSKENYTGAGDLYELFKDSPVAYRRLLGFKPPRFWEALFLIFEGEEDNAD